MSDNPIAIQYFEWYLPADGEHWKRLAADVEQLKSMGVSGVWIPPAYKGMSDQDVGYGVYDKYDLGEFDQKGSVRTKYGTLEDLQKAISALHEAGLKVYGDTVLNHLAGADETETFKAVKVDPQNREKQVSDPFDIEGWTKFTFPGRKGKYSKFEWHFMHFSAVDFDQKSGENGIYRIVGEGKGFSENVDEGKGNFDYLMFADVDYGQQDVVDETYRWGLWFIDKLKLDGLRLDALKHIDDQFIEGFLQHMRAEAGRELYMVGEYWNGDTDVLRAYLDRVETYLALFDVALHFNFVNAAQGGEGYDLRTIFDHTLVAYKPMNVMTFVDNHDSQPGQALESWVQDWFKPLAYALILLRRDGYPCLFYGDYYGIGGDHPIEGKKAVLDPLLEARQRFAYGEQVDYFESPNCIAWARLGDEAHEGSGCLCILTNAAEQSLHLSLGEAFANAELRDFTGNRPERLQLDENGTADFPVNGGSVSVWVRVVNS